MPSELLEAYFFLHKEQWKGLAIVCSFMALAHGKSLLEILQAGLFDALFAWSVSSKSGAIEPSANCGLSTCGDVEHLSASDKPDDVSDELPETSKAGILNPSGDPFCEVDNCLSLCGVGHWLVSDKPDDAIESSKNWLTRAPGDVFCTFSNCLSSCDAEHPPGSTKRPNIDIESSARAGLSNASIAPFWGIDSCILKTASAGSNNGVPRLPSLSSCSGGYEKPSHCWFELLGSGEGGQKRPVSARGT